MEQMKPKARMGRPPKRIGDKQSWRVSVNLTPGEYRAVARAAASDLLSLSEYLRTCWRAVSRKGW